MTLTDDLFSDLLRKARDKYGDRPALVYEGETTSYAEFEDRVNAFAALLKKRGLAENDHVALWGYNSVEWLIAFFGIIKAGGVAVLFNYSTPLEDLKSMMQFTDIRFMAFGNNRELRKSESCIAELKGVLNLTDSQLIDLRKENIQAIGQEIAGLSGEITANYSNKRTSVIMFTSGTSAEPKAVMLSEYGMLNEAIGQAEIQGQILGQKSCLALPFFHSFGLLSIITSLIRGGCIYVLDNIKPDNIIEDVYKYQITDLYSVSAVYFGLIAHPDFNKKVAPFITLCVIGGALAQASHMIRLDEAFYNASFANGYGQTEASPGITMTRPDDPIEKRISTVGRPMLMEDVRISDGRGNYQPDGEVGEIVVKGYNVMNGYYKLPAEEQAVDADGWLHTGDVGYFDEEGYLHFTGRLKDIIIRNGENITPSEIEACLTAIDGISEARVFGAPHPIWGESVEACIVTDPVSYISDEEIISLLKKSLAPFKIPSHFFRFEKFPVMANGKLNQKKLKAEMLLQLRKTYIIKNLDAGICVSSIKVKNSVYNIEPVSDMLKSIAENLEFEGRKVRHITHAARAWMTERISYSNHDVDDIKIDVVFMTNNLRIRFSDGGEIFNIEKNKESNPNLVTILDAVDAFTVVTKRKSAPKYCMDFNFDEDFDIVSYLLHRGSDGRSIG